MIGPVDTTPAHRAPASHFLCTRTRTGVLPWERTSSSPSPADPVAVINNTLQGILETCRGMPERFGTVYAGWHGIEGVLQGGAARPLRADRAKRSPCWRTTPAAGSDRHLPLQAQGQAAGGLRAHRRGAQGPRRRLLLLHRRQRLDGHGPQGRPAGQRARPGPGGDRRAPRPSTTTWATASSS
ncbi:MAG: hypothetical protein M0C28_19380 [Candidatus Moduliflexus flocculans]|nr:hypothetical protein [Candidatus Moduliflexus flocculans]